MKQACEVSFFCPNSHSLVQMPSTTDVKITGSSVINHDTELNKGIESLIRFSVKSERHGVCYELFSLNL